MSTDLTLPELGQTTVFPIDAPSIDISIIGGPPGAGGARYTHNQTTPSAEWIVNHNLGVLPAGVSVYSVGGVLVEAHIIHVSNNQLRVMFTNPYVGRVAII